MRISESDIEAVFRQHRAKMWRLAALLLRDDGAADDAVSEVWLKLCGDGRRLAEVDSVEGFLLTAVRNYCLNAMKARRREPVMVRADMTADTVSSHLVESRDDEGCEDRLQSIERFIAEQLTEQTQRVLRLRFQERMKYAEIARELAISEAAVYKHLAQGLEKLRREFNP